MQDTSNLLAVLLIAILLLVAFSALSYRSKRSGSVDHFERDAPPQPRLKEPDIESFNDVLKSLTPRERQIALLAARGLTNRQIATEVGLSINTVSNHLKRVYPKLEVSSRTELAWRLQYVNIKIENQSRREETLIR
jgi:DNA-binding NarL/FixJ family response regulator